MNSHNESTPAIQQAREQVRTTLAEVAQLARDGCDRNEFHRVVLERVCAALAATGGAVWDVDAQRQIKLAYQHQMHTTGLADSPEVSAQHSRLLYQVLGSEGEEVVAVPPQSGSPEAGNPSSCLLLFARVAIDGQPQLMIEIAQRGDADTTSHSGFLRFLKQVSIHVGDFYQHRLRRELEERQALWTRLEELTRTIHQSLDLRETAYTIVNEGRRLIECDRISLAVVRGTQCRIVAVSGQDQIDRRSTAVRLLERLATSVVRANETIWYRGETSDFAPQVEKAMEAYVDESQTKLMCVVPLSTSLVMPRDESEAETSEEKALPYVRQRIAAKRAKPYAAIIIEQIADGRLTEHFQRRCEIVAAHAASAVGNSLEHHRLFLMPLWKAIGHSRVILAAEYLPKTLAVIGGIFLVAIGLLFLPWSFRVHATGRLEPIVRQRLFAPLDAEVREVFVDHNSAVHKGEVIAELHSLDLENTGQRLLGEGREIDERLIALQRQLTNEHRHLSPQELTQLQGEWAVTQVRKRTNDAQRELFAMQQSLQHVTAPLDGVVVTWDVRNKLRSRPVMRSQLLMEIADPQGAWCLEVAVPERWMGYILDHQRKIPDEPLRVEFVPAADPSARYTGIVDRIADRAELHSDTATSNVSTVLLRVSLDPGDELPTAIRPGAECAVSIDCGKAPLGFVLLCDVITFIERNIIFRYF